MNKIVEKDISYEIDKKDELNVALKMTVAKDAVANLVNTQVEEKAKNTKMPGFRAGKVPLNIVKKQYLPSILEFVINEAVNDAIMFVMKKENFKPAINPSVNIDQYDENKDLTFKVSCELIPEIEHPNFANIKLDKLVLKLDPEVVDEEINKIAKNSQNFEIAPEGTKVENDHLVNINFEGSINGENFEGGTAENYDLLIGSKNFIPGFEDQLIGKSKGEDVLVKVTFPEDYGHKDFAGKDAEFKVKINEIKLGTLPNLEKELPEKLGYENLETLKKDLEERIVKHFEKASFDDLKKSLFDKLEQLCKFDLPPTVVKEEHENLLSQLPQLKMQDASFKGKSDEEISEELQKMAERRVKIGLLVADIAVEEKIYASSEEIAEEMQRQAANFPGQEQQMIDYMLKNPKLVDSLKGPIVENKVVDKILEKAAIKEKSVNKEEFEKLIKANEA